LASPEIDVDNFGGKILNGHCRYARSLITSSSQVGSIVVASHSKLPSPNTVGAEDEIGATLANRGEDKGSRSSTITTTEASLQPSLVSTNRDKGKKPMIPLPSTSTTTSTRAPSTFSKIAADIEHIRDNPIKMRGKLSLPSPNIIDVKKIEAELNRDSLFEPFIGIPQDTTALHTSGTGSLQMASGWPIFV
jgi:hypothetical protein